MAKRALITGITGQDGSYLARLLLGQGYDVYGLTRRISAESHWRLTHLAEDLRFVSGDLTDRGSLVQALKDVYPNEIYNLAAMSFVGDSWRQAELTMDVNAGGLLRLLEAVREVYDEVSAVRIYQASSSEMFGGIPGTCPQDETTPFHPRSPYGVSKVAAHHLAVNYRESFQMHISCGILFNHESMLRGLEFVTRKITDAVARQHTGKRQADGGDMLRLGNISAKRDWGFAGDYVEAMHRMVLQEHADDFVIATGEMHSVQEFLELAYGSLGYDWRRCVVYNDGALLRPAEVHHLCGNSTRAQTVLKWRPTLGFPELVRSMVTADLARHAS